MFTGRCECGDIHLSFQAAANAPSACHCSQCRRISGHFWSAVQVDRASLKVEGPVAWYQSSDHARRGFCANCGSGLFYDIPGRDVVSVAMGSLDGPTGLKLRRHIFVADKGDYYEINDGLPQLETY